MTRRSLLIYIAAALAAGCAGAPATTAGDRAAASEKTDCLRTSLISDWDVLDERNLIVYESGRRPYHVELTQTCFGLDFAQMIGFYDRSADGRICDLIDSQINAIEGACGEIASINPLVAFDVIERQLAELGGSETAAAAPQGSVEESPSAAAPPPPGARPSRRSTCRCRPCR